jgi:hypothetical protein
MSFEWNRIHKWEDNIESQINDSVSDYVFEYYGVDEIGELTEEQINEISTFRDEMLSEFSVMQVGFSNLISWWDSENYEDNG